MKRTTFLYLAFLLLLSPCFAQVHVGYSKFGTAEGIAKTIPDDMLAQLKGTTTIFPIRPDEMEMAAEYEAVFEEVWTITPFKVINANDLKDYMDNDAYSFLTIQGGTLGMQMYTIIPYTYLKFWMYAKKGKKTVTPSFGNIALTPAEDFSGDDRNNMKEDPTYAYTKLSFINWNPILLGCYLRTLNDWIVGGEKHTFLYEFREFEKLSELKSTSLYLPEEAFYKINFSKSKIDRVAPEGETLSEYAYSKEVLPMKEIIQKAWSAEGSFFIYDYVVVGQAGISGVCEASSLKHVYVESNPSMGYSINYRPYPSDMRKIAEAADGKE